MDIYSREKKNITAKFSANYVVRNSEENFYRAEGNVILYNLVTENELRTEELFWYPNEEKFYFCGRKPEGEFPYCKLHVLYAFQPKGTKEEVLDKEDDVPEFIEKKVKASG